MAEGVPQWFGPADRPLFGWVHAPAGDRARAAVVICPSMGQEADFTHHTLRELALTLCEQGFLVVRFAYDGAGDSAGSTMDPARLDAWLDSVRAALALARARTTAPAVLVGMRLGAALAAEVARDPATDVHGLVLWDGPRSGRSFVREQRIRQTAALGDEAALDGQLNALGLTFSAATVAEMSRLDLRALTTLPCEVALSLDRPGVRALARDATARSGPVERHEADDQDELLFRQTTPTRTLARIADWCGTHYPETGHPLLVPSTAPGADTLRLPHSTEHVVRIGDEQLFGILSEPDEPRSGTTVVFVPEFHTPHTGLARIWTDLARDWASLGIRTLRFDVSGSGDSPARPGVDAHQLGRVEHIDDVVAALRFVNPGDPSDTVAIGLCSGAYLALEAAAVVHPRAITLINPRFSMITAEVPVSPRRRTLQRSRPLLTRLLGPVAGRLGKRLAKPEYAPQLTLDPSFDWGRSFEACFWQNYLVRRMSWLPDWAWWVLNALLTVQRPATTFRDLTTAGTDVFFLAGDADYDKATLGSKRALHGLERHGRMHLRHEPRLDHAMMRAGVKDLVMRLLTENTGRVLDLRSPAEPAVGAPVEQQRVD